MRRIAAVLGTIGLCAAPAARAQFPLPAPAPPDPATLFARQCGTCHSVTPGDAPRQGPNLAGVVGRKAGSQAGFAYSAGLAQAGFVWDAARLDAWLADPQAVIPGAVMAYRQANPDVRHSIITWLGEQP
jgi:cytochrome c